MHEILLIFWSLRLFVVTYFKKLIKLKFNTLFVFFIENLGLKKTEIKKFML